MKTIQSIDSREVLLQTKHKDKLIIHKKEGIL